MNRLKSTFISLFFVLLAAALVHGCFVLYRQGPTTEWLGAVIAAVSNLLFFFWLFVAGPARTSKSLWPLLLATTSGTAFSAWGVVRSGDRAGALPLGYAMLVLIGCALYVFWYSRLARADNAWLRIGLRLPRFLVDDVDGGVVDSTSFAGRPTLILFFRGNWCPLCMAQIREIAAAYHELDRRGVQVVLISPQPDESTRALARKFAVPFRFCVDRDNRAARTLGIVATDGLPTGLQGLGYDSDTVFPTAVMTDAAGIIIFADLTDNYRIRPEPETFLRVADQLLE